MKLPIPRRLDPMLLLLTLFAISSCAAPPPKSGLIDGHLRPCPDTPNCLSSEASGAAHIAPLPYSSPTPVAWQNLKKAIADSDGVIVDIQPGYLRAVYTSQLMRFEDDMEFRLDEAAKQIQMRSGSRSGIWDLGANNRRVEQIQRLFNGNEERSNR